MSELNQRARARVRPLVVQSSFPKPTLSMALVLTPSPLTVAVTLVTPNSTLAMSPLAVAVTLVAPAISLGSIAVSPLAVVVTIPEPTVNLV